MSTIEQYCEVITRLVSEVLQCVPPEWQRGTLTMNCDGQRLTYSLLAEDQPGKALLSEGLCDLIDELYIRMAQDNNAWEQSVVTFERKNGEVSFKTSFNHAKSHSPTPTPTPTPAAKQKKRWW